MGKVWRRQVWSTEYPPRLLAVKMSDHGPATLDPRALSTNSKIPGQGWAVQIFGMLTGGSASRYVSGYGKVDCGKELPLLQR